ncbi:hypothetical protein [Fodinicola feengrottensis]|nr:hypothetical protein [Fodinicola feengrottensis]
MLAAAVRTSEPPVTYVTTMTSATATQQNQTRCFRRTNRLPAT